MNQYVANYNFNLAMMPLCSLKMSMVQDILGHTRFRSYPPILRILVYKLKTAERSLILDILMVISSTHRGYNSLMTESMCN